MLSLLLLGIALILIIEGAAYTAVPEQMKVLLLKVNEIPGSQLRSGGIMAVIVGVAIVWALKIRPF